MERFVEMMDNVIRKFGFEDTHSILFCGLVERYAEGECSEASVWDAYDEYMGL